MNDEIAVEADATAIALDQNAKEILKRYIDRIEKLEEDKADVQRDLRELYAEAKGNGFDVRTLKAIITLRKKDEHKREEEETLLDVYLHALGMIPAA